MAHVAATIAHDYDAVAEDYLERFVHQLDRRPLQRAMLAMFAARCQEHSDLPVLDAGCGPGHVAAFLAREGLRIEGIDVSAAMIDLARSRYPDDKLSFRLGELDTLPCPDGAYAGTLSRYSIIHTPPADLPGQLAELVRVTADGGHLLLFFHATTGEPHGTPFDHAVTTGYRHDLDVVYNLLSEFGCRHITRAERGPGPDERFVQAALLVRKSA